MTALLTAFFMLTGSAFILISALGILRFRDVYSRMHATTKATSFGLLLLLIGAGIHFGELIVSLKLLFVIVFLYLTAPLAAHSISSASKKTDDIDKQKPG